MKKAACRCAGLLSIAMASVAMAEPVVIDLPPVVIIAPGYVTGGPSFVVATETQLMLANTLRQLEEIKTPQNASQVQALKARLNSVSQSVAQLQQAVTPTADDLVTVLANSSEFHGEATPRSEAFALQAIAQLSAPATNTSSLAPGLYVHVIDGVINLTNRGGSQNFSAGQFGYTASFIKPPVIVPANPGLQFTPPPSFSSTSGPQGNAGKSTTVDCEVR